MQTNGQQYESPKHVLVPISNPTTARALLILGLALANGNEDQRIMALVVTAGELEKDEALVSELQPIIEDLQHDHEGFELLTVKSSSIVRGILDTAREERANAIVIGVHQHHRSTVDLGGIVENLLLTSPCEVLIYRGPAHEKTNGELKRIVVPTDGQSSARLAAQIGADLAEHFQIPIELMLVQARHRPKWEGERRLSGTVEGLHETVEFEHTLITADDDVSAICARTEPGDLVLIGYEPRSEFERWLLGSFSRRMLNESTVPVLLVSNPQNAGVHARRLISRVIPQLSPMEDNEIERQAYALSAPGADFLALIGISSTLAALGLIVNSPAVIIGAMLVAPFMQPCIGLAIGVTKGQFYLLRRGIKTLLIGVIFSLLFAVLWGLIAFDGRSTSEMLARTSPSLIDAGIAIASGMMGAYATSRKEIPAALAGVAIAAALMPPLCAAGLELSAGHVDTGLRAALLFLTNVVCISVGAWLVFVVLGMRPEPVEGQKRWRWTVYVYGAGLATAALVSVYALLNVSQTTDRVREIQRLLTGSFENAQVVNVEVDDGVSLSVRALVRSAREITGTEVSTVEESLQEAVKKDVRLEVIIERVVRGE
jgi:uncharacterized hydrophobic protein (TIGR00271 family)